MRQVGVTNQRVVYTVLAVVSFSCLMFSHTVAYAQSDNEYYDSSVYEGLEDPDFDDEDSQPDPASAALEKMGNQIKAIKKSIRLQKQAEKDYRPVTPDQSFFGKDTAIDIFGTSMEVTDPNELVLQLPRQAKEEETKAEEKEKPGQEATTGAVAEAPAPAKEEALSPSEAILKKYGNPEEKFEVQATEEAAAPFKAMLEAVKAGDQKLAMRYALQYKRYQSDLLRINKEIVGISGQAAVREGELSDNSWANSPEFAQYKWLQTADLTEKEKKDLEQLQQQVNEDGTVTSLSGNSKAMLEGQTDASFGLFKNDIEITKIDSITLELNEASERKKARNHLDGKLPVEPESQFIVAYFVNLKDPKTMGLADDIVRLRDSVTQKGEKFLALALGDLSDAAKWKIQTKVDLKFRDGRQMAKALKLTKAPAVAYVSTKTDKVYVDTGYKNFYYHDEVLAMMQGKSAKESLAPKQMVKPNQQRGVR